MKTIARKKNGFSLLELIIAIAIFSAASVVFTRFSADIFVYNRIFTAQLEAENDLRTILNPFPSEVRSASPSDTGDYPILLAEEKEFVFYTDVDFNGTRERVRYFLDGTTFKKGILESTGDPLIYDDDNEIIVEVVQNVVDSNSFFVYYGSDYDGESSVTALTQPVLPNFVRLVDITVAVDADPNQPPNEISRSTKVSVRSLKDNF